MSLLQGHCYLSIVNYYSKFISAKNLQNSQSEIVIKECKKVFLHFRITKELNTDNIPEFSSHKFRLISKAWTILYKTISLHCYQSNDFAEKSIQTVKQTLNKAELNSKNRFLVTLSLNSQPNKNGTSPA